MTHDQNEAMAIADRIAVMNKGVIEQLGSAVEIYSRPATRFIASFIGKANFLPAKVISVREHVVELSGGTRLKIPSQELPSENSTVDLMIRPENITVSPAKNEAGIETRMAGITYQGAIARVRAVTPEGVEVLAEIPGSAVSSLPDEGGTVYLKPDPVFARAFAS